jgi:hypothetical protein
MDQARQRVKNNHFWTGRPGLWRQLFTSEQVKKIYVRHQAVFEALGYSCEADASLSQASADENWRKHALPATKIDAYPSWASRFRRQ